MTRVRDLLDAPEFRAETHAIEYTMRVDNVDEVFRLLVSGSHYLRSRLRYDGSRYTVWYQIVRADLDAPATLVEVTS